MKRKYFYRRTNREINQKIYHYQEKQETGRLFNEVANDWESEHFSTVAFGTVKTYAPALQRAKEHFGTTPIRLIKPQHINNFILSFANTGVAKKTVITQKTVLNQIFRFVILNEDVNSNPVAEIPIPKNLICKSRRLPTEKEIEIVKNSIDKPFDLFFYLILYTGLRRGEALALTFEDIGREKNVIIISKSIYTTEISQF